MTLSILGPSLSRDQHLAPARLLNAACGLAQIGNPAFGLNHRAKSAITPRNGHRTKTQPHCLSSPALTSPSYRSATAHQTQLPTCPWGLPVALHNSGHGAYFPWSQTQLPCAPPSASLPELSTPGPPHHPIEESDRHLIQPGCKEHSLEFCPKHNPTPGAALPGSITLWSLFWPGRGALLGPNLNREPTRLLPHIEVHSGPSQWHP